MGASFQSSFSPFHFDFNAASSFICSNSLELPHQSAKFHQCCCFIHYLSLTFIVFHLIFSQSYRNKFAFPKFSSVRQTILLFSRNIPLFSFSPFYVYFPFSCNKTNNNNNNYIVYRLPNCLWYKMGERYPIVIYYL